MSPGRSLIGLGIVVVMLGLLVEFAPALRLGRLPGDFSFANQNVRLFFPIGTSVVLSLILTIVLGLMNRR